MPSPFSAARLHRRPSFHRLTGVGVAAFDAMLGRLRARWEATQRAKVKKGCVSACKNAPLSLGLLAARLTLKQGKRPVRVALLKIGGVAKL